MTDRPYVWQRTLRIPGVTGTNQDDATPSKKKLKTISLEVFLPHAALQGAATEPE